MSFEALLYDRLGYVVDKILVNLKDLNNIL